MSTLEVRREDARTTIAKLIAVHRQTIFDIEFGGKRFWKDGADITRALLERCIVEISQCKTALDGIDRLDAGDVRGAAHLLNRVQETING